MPFLRWDKDILRGPVRNHPRLRECSRLVKWTGLRGEWMGIEGSLRKAAGALLMEERKRSTDRNGAGPKGPSGLFFFRILI